MQTKRKLGFCTAKQLADCFGVSAVLVKQRGESGQWPSYVIAGERVFDADEILALIIKSQGVRPTEAARG